ncbi:hypothetical protein MKK58_24680 [Methylobacterium sp. J-078]|uniref:hypothetical protein n=1 Tax=Methylobacterium sp. J-078 TaxID=2836657 RepID=UPI001FBB99AA|nr:hypothetical protein [Methylobacterium sp. J-078]MCJ2047711.1 hypothetical protein [Methylobacterium sp. J-078]
MSQTDMLAENVTIADLAGRKADRLEYLKGVYLNMVPDQASNPTLRVRLSRLGVGVRPAYRIERDDTDGQTVVMGFYQGDKHKPLPKRLHDCDGPTWSNETMSYVDLRTLHNGAIGA